MSSVFPFPSPYEIHDIDAESRNGRRFKIEICRDPHGRLDSAVTVFQPSVNAPGYKFPLQVTSSSPDEHVKGALVWMLNYLTQVDPTDAIADIHNSCNCPFVSQADQARIAVELGINVPIRVN